MNHSTEHPVWSNEICHPPPPSPNHLKTKTTWTHYRGARDEGILDALVEGRDLALPLLDVHGLLGGAVVPSQGRPAVEGAPVVGALVLDVTAHHAVVQRLEAPARRGRLLVRRGGRRALGRSGLRRALLARRRRLVVLRRVHRSVTCIIGERREWASVHACALFSSERLCKEWFGRLQIFEKIFNRFEYFAVLATFLWKLKKLSD